MKLYALCTLHETGWGTRAGIGDASAATAAVDAENIPEKTEEGFRGAPAYVPPNQHLNQRIPHQAEASPFAEEMPATVDLGYAQ